MLCWKSRGYRPCWSQRTITSGPRHAESDAVDVEKPTSGRLFPCHAPCFATEQYLAAWFSDCLLVSRPVENSKRKTPSKSGNRAGKTSESRIKSEKSGFVSFAYKNKR